MIDPEQVREDRIRRATPAPARCTDPGPDNLVLDQTTAMLAREREGDETALPRQWLARIRGDRRPLTVTELRQAVDELAAQDNVDVVVVLTAIDRALHSEGSSLREWKESLRLPRPRLGRQTQQQGEQEVLPW